jgi:lipoprotein-anchoring transpeptidase ErfK/SrfK
VSRPLTHFLLLFLLPVSMLPGRPAYAQSSPVELSATVRIELLRSSLGAYLDSLHAAGIEEIFTLGRGGNAPSDPIEKMDAVFRGGFRNPEALRVSAAVQAWGRSLRWTFRDLGEPLADLIVIEKSTHRARIYHGETILLETVVATGDPEIGKETPEGRYHVLYVDWQPLSRWKRGNVPYGHEYNPYGARQIPFYQDWTMHGNNDPTALGLNISKGCVRFHNAEIMVIAELIQAVRTRVEVRP